MRQEPPPIRLVCFDLGGVVVRTAGRWDIGCARAGVPYDRGLESEEVASALRLWSDRYDHGLIGRSEYLTRSAEATSLRTPAEIGRVHDAWLIGEYAEVDALVTDLHDRGIVTACLSNTNARHWELMRNHGVPDGEADDHGDPEAVWSEPRPFRAFAGLKHHVASFNIRVMKPDVRAYRAVEEISGVEPAQILFFDDLPVNVEGAIRAGWRAQTVDPGGDTAAQMRRILASRGVVL